VSATEESLSSILSNIAPPEAAVEKGEQTLVVTSAPHAEKVETTEKARDESGKFKATEKAVETAAKVEEKPTTRADVAAIIDERRKRQALEKQLRELQSAKSAERPSVFDNEDAAISVRVEEALRPIKEANYKLSVKAARKEHGEVYAEAEQAFADAAESDPRLYEGLRSSDDPGEYIFSLGLQIKELAGVGGDFVKYREKVTGELSGKLGERDKQIATLTAQVEALTKAQKDLETLPRSLNSKPSGSPAASDADDVDIKTLVRFGNKQS
jgi:hypothetical protein